MDGQVNPTRAEVEAYIRAYAARFRFRQPHCRPDLLIKQCEAESSFEQSATSPCGAIGLFQLMPATARELCVDPYNWRENVEGGVLYMDRLLCYFAGDNAKAFAAYNWGVGRVHALCEAHGSDWREHLPQETKNYLARILGGA